MVQTRVAFGVVGCICQQRRLNVLKGVVTICIFPYKNYYDGSEWDYYLFSYSMSHSLFFKSHKLTVMKKPLIRILSHMDNWMLQPSTALRENSIEIDSLLRRYRQKMLNHIHSVKKFIIKSQWIFHFWLAQTGQRSRRQYPDAQFQKSGNEVDNPELTTLVSNEVKVDSKTHRSFRIWRCVFFV